jgi:hypothetical protein
MPKVFSWRGCRFHFFSNEGSPLEPCHIHVQKDSKRAKFWLDPVISLPRCIHFIFKGSGIT